MPDHATIAAIATAPGQGGIGIVRLSGNAARGIACDILGREPEPRYAHYTAIRDDDGDIIDRGLLLFFPAPASFTGEDVVELQLHGGPVVLNQVLNRMQSLGCRQARAGEFSERAFHNDKIDLVQAEAIADLIAAESEQSARAALHSLQGDFSAAVHTLLEQLTALRMHVESALDFPEEEIDFLADTLVDKRLQEVTIGFDHIRDNCRNGRLLREGLSVVITGAPNAGKSSLLNALAGVDSAIVSAQPGTTRDVIRESISIDGVPLHIIDTAGIREQGDAIEREGIRRAQAELEKADLVIHVVDISSDDSDRHTQPRNDKEILVFNKIDLVEAASGREQDIVLLSVREQQGIDQLKAAILDKAGYHPERQHEGLFSARSRHLQVLERVELHLQRAADALRLQQAGEIMAEELRQAQLALSEITGEFSSDDLLGKIFSEFCIGK